MGKKNEKVGENFLRVETQIFVRLSCSRKQRIEREKGGGERKENDRPVVDCHVSIGGTVDVELEKLFNLTHHPFYANSNFIFIRDQIAISSNSTILSGITYKDYAFNNNIYKDPK